MNSWMIASCAAGIRTCLLLLLVVSLSACTHSANQQPSQSAMVQPRQVRPSLDQATAALSLTASSEVLRNSDNPSQRWAEISPRDEFQAFFYESRKKVRESRQPVAELAFAITDYFARELDRYERIAYEYLRDYGEELPDDLHQQLSKQLDADLYQLQQRLINRWRLLEFREKVQAEIELTPTRKRSLIDETRAWGYAQAKKLTLLLIQLQRTEIKRLKHRIEHMAQITAQSNAPSTSSNQTATAPALPPRRGR